MKIIYREYKIIDDINNMTDIIDMTDMNDMNDMNDMKDMNDMNDMNDINDMKDMKDMNDINDMKDVELYIKKCEDYVENELNLILVKCFNNIIKKNTEKVKLSSYDNIKIIMSRSRTDFFSNNKIKKNVKKIKRRNSI